jgi:iron-sulfur cluster assembly protein
MIQVTESAVRKVRSLMEAEEDRNTAGLRLGVRGGGCSGFSYFMEFTGAARDDDVVYQCFGLPVYVDPRSHELLDGTQLDFNSGFEKHGFQWINPNEKSSCGCGLSFDI